MGQNFLVSPRGSRSATDYVADELRERIKYGRLSPGQRLVEVDLVEQLRVSRGTVRAAFSQLATEGIVTIERNRGARVRVLDIDGIRQFYDVRAVLEGRAAGLCAENSRDPKNRADLQSLREENRLFFREGNFSEYWSYNEALHRYIMKNSGNEVLHRMAEQVRTLTYHYHLLAVTQGDPHRPVSIAYACNQHEEILNSILDGESERAEALMRHHILDNGAGIIESMRKAQNISEEITSL